MIVEHENDYNKITVSGAVWLTANALTIHEIKYIEKKKKING